MYNNFIEFYCFDVFHARFSGVPLLLLLLLLPLLLLDRLLKKGKVEENFGEAKPHNSICTHLNDSCEQMEVGLPNVSP